MVDCFLLLLQADILGGITCTWTNVIGLWFFGLMLLALGVSLYIRYDNITAPIIMGSFAGILLINQYMPPAVSWMLIMILIMVVASVLYLIFTRK